MAYRDQPQSRTVCLYCTRERISRSLSESTGLRSHAASVKIGFALARGMKQFGSHKSIFMILPTVRHQGPRQTALLPGHVHCPEPGGKDDLDGATHIHSETPE